MLAKTVLPQPVGQASYRQRPLNPTKCLSQRRRVTSKVSEFESMPIPCSEVGLPSQPIYSYAQVAFETKPGIDFHNITQDVQAEIEKTGLQEGVVTVISRHTTTAIAINEDELRLRDDIRQFLRRLAPPGEPYLHNDLHLREAPKDWPGGWEAWAKQEPENAHSHLLSMMLGNSESIPVTGGKLAIGVWQSILVVELDGPRKRTVGFQLMGRT
ncbi:hypothetical protein DUNSADRAFT_12736 [Dunaliella salina]|uniref:Secondary thiamine-phosphate synthase enzyme n=1 Tax=Dunaliella salina TaxID=3046 RepID=A0ABQ7GAS0_DUNSA|nr:hypothetical protein DUNSADRAFT_12736 [Dunaliella salina]|eukprot:KAF5831682.1 hypothetical protein DUNSADRAFT_12736 [Dunaliella salina]